jgi:hypothetical protein
MAQVEISVPHYGFKVKAALSSNENGYYIMMDVGSERIQTEPTDTVAHAVDMFRDILVNGNSEELFPGTMDDLDSLCSVRK